MYKLQPWLLSINTAQYKHFKIKENQAKEKKTILVNALDNPILS